MALDKIIQFFIKYNAVLIEALVGAIIIIVGFLAYRSFAQARDEVSGAKGTDLHDLEEMIKKLLERANQVPTSAALAKAGADGAVDTSPLLNEIEKLRIDLQTKQAEIEQMKSQSAKAPSATPAPGMSTEEKATLENQIKELQNKLAEYEIISEDIADLSFYKEENAKLRKQIESAGSVAAPAAATPSPAAAPPAPATPSASTPPTPEPMPASAPPPPVEPAGATAGPEIAANASFTPEPPAPTSQESAPPTDASFIDDDLMKEFAQAVADQKASTSETEAPAAPTPPPAADPVQAAPAAPTATPAASAGGDVDLGSLDIDKMMNEAGTLEVADVAAAPSAEEVLSQELDPDKLALEADTLNNVKPEDKELMGQFENFVKKESR
ncbi:MAG: hypothetical protein BroJett040_07710 [Oligoflexia bacterium]|nr:MAG: hypothetical protein BroJett040_07710 [Oligoflexia bacterium]